MERLVQLIAFAVTASALAKGFRLTGPLPKSNLTVGKPSDDPEIWMSCVSWNYLEIINLR